MFKKYYLAYGSNLNLEKMKERCPKAKCIGTFVLEGYRLIFKGSSGKSYLTIERCEEKSVPLGIFEVGLFDVIALDRYEAFPMLYKKENVIIKLGSKEVNAFIYVMNDEYGYNLPSEKYLDECIKGYRDFGFDVSILGSAYLDTLEKMLESKNDLKRR